MVPGNVTSMAVKRAVSRKRPLIEDRISIEQALPLVGPQVQDAFDRLIRFGIPYFNQLLHR